MFKCLSCIILNIRKTTTFKNLYQRSSISYAKAVSKIKKVDWNKFCLLMKISNSKKENNFIK